MEKSVKELAEFLKGTVEHDNPELKITGVNGLVEAGPQDIGRSFKETHRQKARRRRAAPHS